MWYEKKILQPYDTSQKMGHSFCIISNLQSFKVFYQLAAKAEENKKPMFHNTKKA